MKKINLQSIIIVLIVILAISSATMYFLFRVTHNHVIIHRMINFQEVMPNSKLVIKDKEAVKQFTYALRFADKQPGKVDIADPPYQFTLGEKEYYLWVSEQFGLGTLMKPPYTGSVYNIDESRTRKLLDILNKAYGTRDVSHITPIQDFTNECAKVVLPSQIEKDTSLDIEKELIIVYWTDPTTGENVGVMYTYTDHDCSESAKEMTDHLLETTKTNVEKRAEWRKLSAIPDNIKEQVQRLLIQEDKTEVYFHQKGKTYVLLKSPNGTMDVTITGFNQENGQSVTIEYIIGGTRKNEDVHVRYSLSELDGEFTIAFKSKDFTAQSLANEYMDEEQALEAAKSYLGSKSQTVWSARLVEDQVIEMNNTDELYTVWIVEALYPAGNKESVHLDAVTGWLMVLTEDEAPDTVTP